MNWLSVNPFLYLKICWFHSIYYLQSFEPDDYRNIRFTNATRYVNKNWGISTQNLKSWKYFIVSCSLHWYFHRHKFGRWSPTEGMHRTCCLLWWWRSTFRSSKGLHQFGKTFYSRQDLTNIFNQDSSNSLITLLQDKPGAHACGYCGLRFILKDGHHHWWIDQFCFPCVWISSKPLYEI